MQGAVWLALWLGLLSWMPIPVIPWPRCIGGNLSVDILPQTETFLGSLRGATATGSQPRLPAPVPASAQHWRRG